MGRVPPELAQAGDTVVLVPSREYRASGFHRFLLGSGYRDVWALPIRVEVLDLDAYAGGLTPVQRGGGAQTRSLRLQGADGNTYLFRSVDKDATQALDPVIRESLAADILQDQISLILPTAALVVDPILEAAGVLHAVPRLYVMPDDPRLGEHRATFAGMLGLVEIRPDEADDGAGFAGSERIVGSESFLDRIEDDQDDRIDGDAYLRARLLDALLGDWDRHPDQWRWAAFDSAGVRWWRPIPRDRDWALSRVDGMMALAVAGIWPHYTGFGRDFPAAWRATWSARKLDRELLSELSSEAWQRTAVDLQARLTEDVIDRAVEALPPPHREAVGPELAAGLRSRRDALPEFAAAYYALLAEAPDVYATDEEEWAEAVVLADGSVRLTLAKAGNDGPEGPPFFDRTFAPSETREVRVYLRGDDDHFVASGTHASPITVRVIGGGGDDAFEDRSSASVARFYDDRGDNSGQGIDDAEYDRPRDLASPSHEAFARDWGSLVARTPTAAFDPDNGLVLGGSIDWIRYGFRRHPYARRFGVDLAFGTFTGLPRAALELELPGAHGLGFAASATVSGLERHHFYGFGNETSEEPPEVVLLDEPDDGEAFFRAERWDARLQVGVRWTPSPTLTVEAGPFLRYTVDREEEGRLVGLLDPPGSGSFQEAGVTLRSGWDGRDRGGYPMRGATLGIEAVAAPAVLDVDSAFARGAVDASAYLTATAPFEVTLGVRARGEHVWGVAPYQEAAYIGGRGTLRGFRRDRFAGDAALVSTAELRVPLFDFRALVPGELGLLGLADVGRVWVDEETSDTWHSAFGGGVFVAVLDRRAAFSLYVARGGGRTGIYAGKAVTF
ncbi:MAG TPA: BamA/TamA family outer membrane protein [Longimicrobiales bacterium]|nr:BamA/TamA family outer membrane protein [Longimicrobiales bacterium]